MDRNDFASRHLQNALNFIYFWSDFSPYETENLSCGFITYQFVKIQCIYQIICKYYISNLCVFVRYIIFFYLLSLYVSGFSCTF